MQYSIKRQKQHDCVRDYRVGRPGYTGWMTEPAVIRQRFANAWLSCFYDDDNATVPDEHGIGEFLANLTDAKGELIQIDNAQMRINWIASLGAILADTKFESAPTAIAFIVAEDA
eukprot:240302-Amphidinium_carterae.1